MALSAVVAYLGPTQSCGTQVHFRMYWTLNARDVCSQCIVYNSICAMEGVSPASMSRNRTTDPKGLRVAVFWPGLLVTSNNNFEWRQAPAGSSSCSRGFLLCNDTSSIRRGWRRPVATLGFGSLRS